MHDWREKDLNGEPWSPTSSERWHRLDLTYILAIVSESFYVLCQRSCIIVPKIVREFHIENAMTTSAAPPWFTKYIPPRCSRIDEHTHITSRDYCANLFGGH